MTDYHHSTLTVAAQLYQLNMMKGTAATTFLLVFVLMMSYRVTGSVQRQDTTSGLRAPNNLLNTFGSDTSNENHQHISSITSHGLSGSSSQIASNHLDHHQSESSSLSDRSDLDEMDTVAAAQAAAAAAASLRGPYFDTGASKNVTALVGKTASLACRVRNLGNRTVSWIRHRDIHLLTVGRSTYTSDQRFSCIHNPQTEEWILQVRYPQRRDSGIYECQVSTTPPIGHSMYLSVVEPVTTILGGPDIYINRGSTMNLTCIVKHSPEPPPAIFWTHNDEGINYDSPRGGVSVITEKGDITVSYLLVQRARASDSGKYTCNPSNANSKSVIVHVLNGEYPAAMQHGGQLRLEYPISACLLSVLITFLGT